MKKGKFIYYGLLIITMILPIFSDHVWGPEYRDYEIDIIKDSLLIADSLEFVIYSKPLNINKVDYQKSFNHRLDSICEIQDLDKFPSIYKWTQNDYSGIGLIKELYKYRIYVNKGFLFIITALFYIWIIIQFVLTVLGRKFLFDIYMHFWGILISLILLILIIIEFPLSVFYYLIFILIMIKEIKYINYSS
jgi:hypothetical protein